MVNMVAGAGADVDSQLVHSSITKLATLTGGIRAGQVIYADAAHNITVLSLELGGKGPFILLQNADVDKAVEAAVITRYANLGQECIRNEQMMVLEVVAAEFTDKLVAGVDQIGAGDPVTQVDMGPSVTEAGLGRIRSKVDETVASGAEVLTGGRRPKGAKFERGTWYERTVVASVRSEQVASVSDIFGPVMPIMTVSGY